MQEMQVRSLSQEDPLETDMATHSSTLAWEVPRTEELQPMGSQRVWRDLATKQQQPIKFRLKNQDVPGAKIQVGCHGR